jgi:hypothetical protein
MNKSRSMRWAGHAERMMAIRNAYKIVVGKLEGKVYLKGPGADGMIILK